MRIIYRALDNLVVWFEPDNRRFQDYLEPIWQDDFRQRIIEFQAFAKRWHAIMPDGTIAPVSIPPENANEVLIWKARARALSNISDLIAMQRSSYIPPILGQETIYRLKLEEAQAFLANPKSTVTPLITAWAETKGVTQRDAVNMVWMRNEQYQKVLAASEAERHQLVNLVLQASTVQEADNVSRIACNRMERIQ